VVVGGETLCGEIQRLQLHPNIEEKNTQGSERKNIRVEQKSLINKLIAYMTAEYKEVANHFRLWGLAVSKKMDARELVTYLLLDTH